MREANSQVTLRNMSGFLIIQVVLLIWVGWQNRDAINIDAVSYIRIAQYYASGQMDLMISGAWGPMLSWIIAPLLSLVADPLYAAHIAMGLSAILYLLGCMAILRVLGIGSTAVMIGVGIVVPFSVHWSVKYITPDLLMSGILCMAISRVMIPGWYEKPSVQFSSGLLFGAAYLAKAVALPISFLVIIAAGVIWTINRQISPISALKSAAVTFLGLILLAGPWILILSFKYERPVFSTSGGINHSIMSPSNVKPDHPTFQTLHVPEQGRITSWEDPSTLSYSSWSPFESLQNMKHQLGIIRSNAKRILSKLRAFDVLGLGLVAVILGLLIQVPGKENSLSTRWRWTGIFIGCLVVVYLPVFGGDTRYYLATYPFLLGGSLGFVLHLAERAPSHANILRIIAITLVSLSFLIAQGVEFPSYQSPTYKAAKVLSQKLKTLGMTGPIVSMLASPRNLGALALYTAYLMETPFYGVHRGAQTVEEVKSSSAKIIIVDRGAHLDSTLHNDERFISLDEKLFDSIRKDYGSDIKIYINTKI